MKIITERINQNPPHSISKQDIETILKFVPQEGFGIRTIFKISAQLYSKSKWDRPVIENGTTYIIMSRGFSKEHIVKELLIEIFSNQTKISFHTKAHHLNNADRKKLEKIVQPIFDKVLIELSQ
jgi:hypothetical protein